ncbi:MAG TPA: fused MFS/spermidine synthase [Burkholderiales bacterium]|nr:fused MFS/spermidine synthase [Burkholderiales bacterium]
MTPHHHLARAALVWLLAFCTAALAAERVLYDKPSKYNNIIVTEDSEGFRVLRFERGGARQSITKPGQPEYLGFAYTKVAFAGLALVENPRRMLVVGVGGGTMPMFLRKHYPDATIDAVDIDPDVVQVARDYFGFREDARLKAHVGDGRAFVEGTREPYDVVFLDAFGTRNVPPHLTTIEFMRAVKRAVSPNGIVVWNIWGRGANPLFDAMARTYLEVFDDVYMLDVPGTSNKILLARPQKLALDRLQLVEAARRTASARGFQFDLADITDGQFHHLTRRSVSGRVLRDADSGQPVGAARSSSGL